jgi:hypothetical protein
MLGFLRCLTNNDNISFELKGGLKLLKFQAAHERRQMFIFQMVDDFTSVESNLARLGRKIYFENVEGSNFRLVQADVDFQNV